MRSISRRKFLLKMGAGVGILLPMWRTMIPEVMGQETTRKRMIIYAGAVSMDEREFPSTNSRSGNIALKDSFSALKPYTNEMMFIRGLDAHWHQTQHGPDWSLTGRSGTPGGISLDRYIARRIGQSDPVLSIQLAMVSCNKVNDSVSADGAGQKFPAQTNPVSAYGKIFASGTGNSGGGGGADPAIVKQLAERRSALDVITGDVNRMKSQLAGPERAKLDQYLSSFRDMERELSNLVQSQSNQPSAACNNVSAPGNPGSITSASARSNFMNAQISVATNAVICGMTRVAVLHKNCSSNYPGGVGSHTMWHDNQSSKTRAYYRFHTAKLASIRKRLGEVSEGGGTVADNSLIVYTERCGMRHHYGQRDSFLLTIGSAGGYFRTGTYHNFNNLSKTSSDPKVKYNRATRNLNDGFISIANAMGVSTNSFGERSSGPLPGLKA